MHLVITDATGLDNYRGTPHPCGHIGPYVVTGLPKDQPQARCNRPRFHRGAHAFSTLTTARLCEWGDDQTLVRPTDRTRIDLPPRRRKRR